MSKRKYRAVSIKQINFEQLVTWGSGSGHGVDLEHEIRSSCIIEPGHVSALVAGLREVLDEVRRTAPKRA